MGKYKKALEVYTESDKQEKIAKDSKASVRSLVETFLDRCKRMGVAIKGVTFYKADKFTYNDELILDWLKSKMSPDDFNKVTKLTIDYEKLNEARLQGLIDLNELPEYTYSINSSKVIKISKK